MKKLLGNIPILFVVAISLNTLSIGSRADHNAHPEVLRAIREHAQALKKDAAAYQRKRMNSHLAHILEDAKTLRKAMISHSCLQADTDAIQKVVSDLRSAIMDTDAQKTANAVNRLSDLSDAVLKRYCKEDNSLPK